MIENKNKYSGLPKLNGNVIDITPLIKDEWYKIKEKLEEEKNGKEETKLKKRKYAFATEEQERIADKLWSIELKKMDSNPDYIPKIIDPETIDIKLTSAPHPGESWFGLWEDLDSKGIVPKGIKTITDFKKWFHKQDLDVEMFSRGGLASLRGKTKTVNQR